MLKQYSLPLLLCVFISMGTLRIEGYSVVLSMWSGYTNRGSLTVISSFFQASVVFPPEYVVCVLNRDCLSLHSDSSLLFEYTFGFPIDCREQWNGQSQRVMCVSFQTQHRSKSASTSSSSSPSSSLSSSSSTSSGAALIVVLMILMEAA